jgi:hypothetical protein
VKLERLVRVHLMGGFPTMHVEARLGNPRLQFVGVASGLVTHCCRARVLGRGKHHDHTHIAECRERAQGVAAVTHALPEPHKDQSCSAGLRLASVQSRG